MDALHVLQRTPIRVNSALGEEASDLLGDGAGNLAHLLVGEEELVDHHSAQQRDGHVREEELGIRREHLSSSQLISQQT